MNDREHELFEAELHRLKPAEPPEQFMARLAAAQPGSRAPLGVRSRPVRQAGLGWQLVRWLAPAAAAAAVAVVLLVRQTPRLPGQPVIATAVPALTADDIEIDRQLVASFDAVAWMSDGEPIRFRCREWMDNVTLRDSTRGVEVERSTPRLEVVPIRFETY